MMPTEQPGELSCPPAPARPSCGGAAPLLEISGLAAEIDGVRILHDVRLTLRAGEIYGLLGPNGAGKSTTIAVALGLLGRATGRVLVHGRDPRDAAPGIYGRLGVLTEQNGFYDWMPAEAYLGFFATLHRRRYGAGEIGARLAAVGLTPRRSQAIGTYSRGMRQRLGLARALIAEPELVILDEPTNGLDPRGRREIHDILLALAGRGVGVLLCTHLLDDVDRLCDRIGIIVEGRTVAEGATADLIGRGAGSARFRLRLSGPAPAGAGHPDSIAVTGRDDPWTRVSLEGGAAPEAAWRDLLARGWPIVEIRREAGGIEDLYLGLTKARAP